MTSSAAAAKQARGAAAVDPAAPQRERASGNVHAAFASFAETRASWPGPRTRQAIADQAHFLKTSDRPPRLTGSVAPSGRALARAMAHAVDPARDGLVVELGPGTGPVTQALVERGIEPRGWCWSNTITASAACSAQRFPGARVDPGRRLRSAARRSPQIARRADRRLRLEPAAAQRAAGASARKLIEDAFALMGPEGLFVQFTYGVGSPIPREICASRYSAQCGRADLAQSAAGAGVELSRRRNGASPSR